MLPFIPEPLAAWCSLLVAVLAHSLWQSLLIGAAVWTLLRTVPARRAQLRYSAAAGGLAAVVLAAFATWTALTLPAASRAAPQAASTPSAPPAAEPLRPRSVAESAEAVEPPADARGQDNFAPARSASSPIPGASRVSRPAAGLDRAAQESPSIWPVRLQQFAPALVALWLAGVIAMLARTVSAIMRPQAWLAREPGVDPVRLRELELLLAELAMRWRLARVAKLVPCSQVSVPAVLGILWPVILVPPAMLVGGSAEQWRIILAHELAHIRRYDNLVNLLQMLIESVFFFNPAVWWISRQVRAEREAACDALAAQVAGRPLSVARTLVEVAHSLGQGSMPALPVAVTAFAEP
ncbi:MAG: M56 family metallopeptidase, partial [Thermoguttaceae bacterium]